MTRTGANRSKGIRDVFRINRPRVTVTPGFILMLSVLFYFSRAGIFLSMLAAALVHEAGHLAAICLARGNVSRIRLSITGAAIFLDELSYPAEAACAAAGPLSSLVFAVLGSLAANVTGLETLFAFSGMSLVNGLINALPAAELDGARTLRALLFWRYGHDNRPALYILGALGLLCSFAVTAAGLYVLFITGFNTSLLVIGIWMLFMSFGYGATKEKILGIA